MGVFTVFEGEVDALPENATEFAAFILEKLNCVPVEFRDRAEVTFEDGEDGLLMAISYTA